MDRDRTEETATDHVMLDSFGDHDAVDQRIEDALAECRATGHHFDPADEARELCTRCGLHWAPPAHALRG